MILFIIIAIGIISTIIYIMTIYNTDLYLKIFLFCSVGLGSYYNLKYRIGSLMISDIALVLFSISYLNYIYKNKVARLKITNITMIIASIFIYMIILGITSRYSFSNILRDVKVFAYFFITLHYVYFRRKDKYFKNKMWKFLIKLAIFTLIINLYSSLTTGISGVGTGKIDRVFGLGLGSPILVIVSTMLFINKDIFLNKYNYILYYLSQMLLIITIILSFTRNVWIQLVITYMTMFMINIFNIKKEKRFKINIKNMFLSILILMLSLGYVYNLKVRGNEIYDIIEDRVLSIFSTTGVGTLQHRMNDLEASKYKYKNIRIIFGYGFGDKVNNSTGGDGVTAENSFLYYSWKYGIVLFLILIIFVNKQLLNIYNRKDTVNRGLCISLYWYMIIASMSGNLSKYYGMPILAILLILDFSNVVYDNEKIIDKKV